MAFQLHPQPSWSKPSGDATALALGLWVGAAAVVLLVLGGLGGDVGMVMALLVTAVVPGALLPLAVLDLLRSRQASHALLSGGIAVATLAFAAWTAAAWILPSAPSMPPAMSDELQAAVPALLGLLAGAERAAARGKLAWRDRLLGAAAGYAIVAGVFLIGVETLPWLILLPALAVRLPANARVALAVLAGVAALGLGQYFEGVWLGRAVEWVAWAAYGAASLAVHLRQAPPASPATTAAANPGPTRS